MQIWMVQRLRAQLNASDNPLEVAEQNDTARKTWTKEFIEKVQAIIDETPQRPIWQIARDLGVSHTTVKACVKEDLKCRFYRCQTSQILTEKTSPSGPLLPRPEPTGLLHLVICQEHHQHDLPQHQSQLIAAIHQVFAELPPALVEKACSQFRIRNEVVIEAEGGYIE